MYISIEIPRQAIHVHPRIRHYTGAHERIGSIPIITCKRFLLAAATICSQRFVHVTQKIVPLYTSAAAHVTICHASVPGTHGKRLVSGYSCLARGLRRMVSRPTTHRPHLTHTTCDVGALLHAHPSLTASYGASVTCSACYATYYYCQFFSRELTHILLPPLHQDKTKAGTIGSTENSVLAISAPYWASSWASSPILA